MRRIKVVLWTLSLMLLTVGFGLPLMAQDATATPTESTDPTGTLINCDSSLLLLAGLAHRYFGYTGAPDIDLTTYEYGQYAQLFDMSAADEPPVTGTAEPIATAEPMATTEAAATAEGMVTPALASIFLNLPIITGENLACGQLRGSLETFFNEEFAHPDWDTRFRGGLGGRASSQE